MRRSPSALSAARQYDWSGRNQPDAGGLGWLSRREPAPRDAPASAEVVSEKAQVSITGAARLEAALLTAREPLSTRKLAHLAGLEDATEARTLLKQVAARLDRRGAAFALVRVAGGYRLLTRPQFAPWLARLATPAAEPKLTPPALETLVVVAYQQPVLRAEVEAIRGVGCGEMLRQLMDRGLLRIVGRSEELGRPLMYGTTKEFLQWFGLASLNDLPSIEESLQATEAAA